MECHKDSNFSSFWCGGGIQPIANTHMGSGIWPGLYAAGGLRSPQAVQSAPCGQEVRHGCRTRRHWLWLSRGIFTCGVRHFFFFLSPSNVIFLCTFWYMLTTLSNDTEQKQCRVGVSNSIYVLLEIVWVCQGHIKYFVCYKKKGSSIPKKYNSSNLRNLYLNHDCGWYDRQWRLGLVVNLLSCESNDLGWHWL